MRNASFFYFFLYKVFRNHEQVNKLLDLLPLNFELCDQLQFIELLQLEKSDEFLTFNASAELHKLRTHVYIFKHT